MKKVLKRGKVKQTLAAMVFCMALGAGTVCSADEGKVTVESAKIRAAADASSEQVGSVKQGGTVDIIGETAGTDGKNWYQVWVNGTDKGYIRADLIERTQGTDDAGTVSTLTNESTDNVATTAQPADTSVTPTEARRATVSTSSANIRKGASTNDEAVATANRGMVLTVTGEAAGSDGKTWYQVSFTYNDREITGFIRSDLVSFDDVPADEAVSNITGTEAGGEQEAGTETQAAPTEEQSAEQPPAEDSNSGSSQGVVLMNVDETPYIMPEFVPVELSWNDQKIKAWKNGDFLIFYAQVNGVEGWYLMDSNSDNVVYTRYVYATPDAVIPEDSAVAGGILPIAVLAVIIVILLAVIGLMFLKLREYGNGYDDEDDDDYYGDDDDDLEELEDDEEDDIPPAPVRRAARPAQPQRRPQPQQDVQPQRRPQQGQPQRRPQPQQGQPQRRPQSEGGMRRGPEGDGRVVTRQGNARPAQPQRRPQPQQGQQRPRPKNSSNGQDDMDFIDI